MFWPFKNQSNKKNQWGSFKGRENSEEVLIEKANLLAEVLIEWSKVTTDGLFEFVEKDSKQTNIRSKFNVVLLEVLVFYLHMTDRIAQRFLERPKANFFVDTLLPRIREILLQDRLNSTGLSAFAKELRDTYNDRQLEYGYYKFKPGKDEGFKNTLFWEFEKKITNILTSPMDFPTIMAVQIAVVEGLEHLELPRLFEA